ncbi:hypothetical protein MANY_42890 [Mycolicibacterium anyangense]|uniref:Secreted protein n=1 Tax=Mycolicibacterium anyangense TaxID=1431246 RepID=A0A6N4WGA4_9MYCO|nr:hypothetical protein MANY_42890 [Mycolicibacterium anyangense]
MVAIAWASWSRPSAAATGAPVVAASVRHAIVAMTLAARRRAVATGVGTVALSVSDIDYSNIHFSHSNHTVNFRNNRMTVRARGCHNRVAGLC